MVFFHILEPFQESFLRNYFWPSMLAYRRWYVARINQIAALGYVSRTNQSFVFVLWFERCSNFNEVMGDSERAVRKMESSIRMRNVGFCVSCCENGG